MKKHNLSNIDIFFNELDNNSMYFTIGQSNKSHDDDNCVIVTIYKKEKSIQVDDIKHCGINITLLLNFIYEINEMLKYSIHIIDSSRLEFINETTKDITFIHLKMLYELTEGISYYNKYLFPDSKRTKYPEIPFSFFSTHSSLFVKEEHDIIEEIEALFSTKTLGDFFRIIRQKLKEFTIQNLALKPVLDENWQIIKIYKHIIEKTYNQLELPPPTTTKIKSPPSQKTSISSQKKRKTSPTGQKKRKTLSSSQRKRKRSVSVEK